MLIQIIKRWVTLVAKRLQYVDVPSMGIAAIYSLKHAHLAKFLPNSTTPFLTVFHSFAGGKSQLVPLTHKENDRLGGSYAIETTGECCTLTTSQSFSNSQIHGKYHHALIFTLISGTLYLFYTLGFTCARQSILINITYIISSLNLVNHI